MDRGQQHQNRTGIEALDGKLLLGTSNLHKIEEIKRILDLPLRILTTGELGPITDPIEDGETYLDNARIKAHYYAKHFGLPCLADDSGLEVDALHGQPGVHSARFMGRDTPYRVRLEHMLERLAGLPEERRGAQFVCSVVLAWPDGRELHHTAVCRGRIAHEICGTHGFGYDPLFWVPEHGATFAELEAPIKDAISHRALALRGVALLLTGSS